MHKCLSSVILFSYDYHYFKSLSDNNALMLKMSAKVPLGAWFLVMVCYPDPDLNENFYMACDIISSFIYTFILVNCLL